MAAAKKTAREIEKAADWLGNIDLMHSNGAIQYVDDTIAAVKVLCATRAATMVWYSVPVSDGEAKTEVQTSLLSDNGPGQLTTGSDKLVKCARHWITKQSSISAHEGHRLTSMAPIHASGTLSSSASCAPPLDIAHRRSVSSAWGGPFGCRPPLFRLAVPAPRPPCSD